MATYAITAAAKLGDHLEWFIVHERKPNPKEAGKYFVNDQPELVGRTTIVSNLESKTHTYVTRYKKNADDDTWQVGADVRVIELKSGKYLESSADKTSKDNLLNLPRF
jgi:Protein of unknown function (DUF3892)